MKLSQTHQTLRRLVVSITMSFQPNPNESTKQPQGLGHSRIDRYQQRMRWWIIIGTILFLSLASHAGLRQEVSFEFEAERQGDILYLLGGLPELGCR